jgi:hypothetical protein
VPPLVDSNTILAEERRRSIVAYGVPPPLENSNRIVLDNCVNVYACGTLRIAE